MEVEDTHIYCSALDPLMDDNDDEENPFHTEPCGTEDDNALGWAGFGVELTKKREAQDNKVDEWKAFHTKTWGAEDEDDTNWARLEGQPVKKGEECNVKEDTEKEDTPYSKSQLAPCNMLHVYTISTDLVPHQALDGEGYTPQIGDRHPQTISLCREQVADTMCHIHHLHNVVHSLEHAHLNDPKPATCMCKGQAHQAPWPRPGTVTEEQDAHPASAALLKGEKKWMLSMSSKQTAALDTSLISNTPILPTLSPEATPLPSKPAPGLNVSPSPVGLAENAQQECVPSPSCTNTAMVEIWFDPDPQPGSYRLAHLGTNDPCLVYIPAHPRAFAVDPGESGGVLTVENGALAPHTDPNGTEPVFMADTADAVTPDPCMHMEAKHSHDWPPWEEPTESPVICKAHTAAQGLSQMGSININPRQSDHGECIIHPLQPVHTDTTFPCYQLANHELSLSPVDHLVCPLTELAPASTVECPITCNVPHHEAVNTLTWAASATCPATTFADTNGSMAIYQHAKLGHGFPINGSTMPLFLRPQEAALPLTIRSGHIAMVHGSQEASHPYSPVSGTSVNPNAPAPSFPNNHAAVTFKCDYPYHPPDLLGHQEVKPPGPCAADNMVADVPTPLLSAKEKHFATSPGPHAK